MKFFQVAIPLSLAVASQAAAIPDDQGLIGNMCNEVTQKFSRFGQCVSQLPSYQLLSNNFWYQASRKVLCGYDMELPVNGTIPGLPYHQKSVKKDTPNDDLKLSKDADALYKLQQEKLRGVDIDVMEFDKRYFTYEQCINTCESVQSTSNALDSCWAVAGVTVVYAVCEAGCAYYY